MLIINDEEVQELLPMEKAIQAIEDSYREVAEGTAINVVRSRARTLLDTGGLNYLFNCIPGLIPSREVMAVRLDSAVRECNPKRSNSRYLGDQYCGWVVLFSIRTGEPLAIMDDFSFSGIHVGATIGIGVNYLAKKDARRVAPFGSGK